MFLVKDKTSQQEILEMFGGPNMHTGDGHGNEMWTYDRMSYETSSSVDFKIVVASASAIRRPPHLNWG